MTEDYDVDATLRVMQEKVKQLEQERDAVEAERAEIREALQHLYAGDFWAQQPQGIDSEIMKAARERAKAVLAKTTHSSSALAAALDAREAAEAAAAREAVEGVSDPGGEYYTGLYCGVEDRGITDRYEAAIYGWQQAFAFMESALAPPPPGALDRVRIEGIKQALKVAEEAIDECEDMDEESGVELVIEKIKELLQ